MADRSINQSSAFYNVMPQVAQNKAAQVKPQNTAPTVNTLQGRGPGTANKNKAILIIVPSLLVLLAIGGVVAWFLMDSNSEPVTQEVVTPPIAETPIETTPEVSTPPDWLLRYFGSETCTEINICGDSADADRDGLNNKKEHELATDPNLPDSDGDGLADGDEVNIFKSNPLLSKTWRGEGDYRDPDFVKNGYDINTNEPYNESEIIEIKSRVKEFGMHQPTISTLGDVAITLYDFIDPTSSAMLNLNIDQSSEAKLDRDSQRLSTIKKIGGALIKYRNEKRTFPPGEDFVQMADTIKSYNTVATNYNDPINLDRYVYGYRALNNNLDFELTYYSETQNLLIKYKASDAEAEALKNNTKEVDDNKKTDLERIRNALLIYSASEVDPNSEVVYVFPTVENYQAAMVPKYFAALPKDPHTGQDYQYQVGELFDTFTIRAVLLNPAPGTTGYLCNQDECRDY